MAKLLKLRRGTTSQHSSFTGAEGEVTVDTTKDVLVVHDGSTAGGHAMAAQDMDNVPAGSILGTQLENSGVTAGQYGSSSAIPIVTVDAQGLVTAASTTAIDSTTIANGTSNVAVANNGNITATRSGTARLVVDDAGVDVTGNITGTGTLTTQDITIQDQQPRLNFIDNAGSPNNPDYLFQVDGGTFLLHDMTNTADRFSVAANGHITSHSNHNFNAGVDVTGNITSTGNIFTGDNQYYYVGDANDGRYYHDGDHTYLEETGTGELRLASHNGPGVRITKGGSETLANFSNDGSAELYHDNSKKIETTSSGVSVTGNIALSGTIDGRDLAADGSKLDGIEASATADQTASEILTAIKTVDGGGSGLDADTVDGIQSSSFIRSDTADTASGDVTFSGGAGAVTIGAGSDLRFSTNSTGWTGDHAGKIQHHGSILYIQGGTNGSHCIILRDPDGTNRVMLDPDGHWTPMVNNTYDLGSTTYRWRNLYTNDLNLSNEGSSNDIDGTWGDWTIQEGESDLFLKNNRSGKKYKFNLTEVS